MDETNAPLTRESKDAGNLRHSDGTDSPRTVRLPGFIVDHDVGLGDAIKYATSSLGFHPCGGCQERAAKMNKWLVFTGSNRSG